MRYSSRSRIALRSRNYCVSAFSNMNYSLRLLIHDPLCAVTCLVSGADNAAYDPHNSRCVPYLSHYRKTVFVLRKIIWAFPAQFSPNDDSH